MAEKRLDEAHISFGSIHGNITPDDRANYIEQFQAGKLQVMLLTTSAGGEGITLTAADTMVFLQRPYSLIENKQVMARIDRIGQFADQVTIIDLISTDTAEDRVFEILNAKEERLEEVVRDKQRLRELLVDSIKQPSRRAKQ